MLSSGTIRILAIFAACAMAATAVHAQPIELMTVNETEKLLAIDGSLVDIFGVSVAISGDAAVIGASQASPNKVASGAAYVYQFDGTAWNFVQTLSPSDGSAGDLFGNTVAIHNNVIVIGAWSAGPHGTLSGAAYAYQYDGTQWAGEVKLTASDGEEFDKFGFSVSIFDDRIAIGAISNRHNEVRSGSIYIYQRNENSWIEEMKIAPSNGEEFDWFGFSVSISSNMIAVGAPSNEKAGPGAGAAYIFQQTGSNWTKETQLLPDNPFGGFGGSVATFQDQIFVSESLNNSGSVHVYKKISENWERQERLSPTDGVQGMGFGSSIAVSNNTALIGAVLDEKNGEGSGSAYVFKYDEAHWTQRAKVLPSDGESDDQFGVSVGISESVALVGAWHDDDAGANSGSAYVFDLSTLPCPADWNGDGQLDIFDLFQFLIAFQEQDSSADFHVDGAFTAVDVFDYISSFRKGCP